MLLRGLSQLLEKPGVALKEQLNIIHAILHDRDAFHAHAESESRNLGCVIVDEAVHIRIDHAAAEKFDPSAGLAVAAGSAVARAFAIAEDAADLHVGAGLGEGEERWIEARLDARAEHRFHGVVERAL